MPTRPGRDNTFNLTIRKKDLELRRPSDFGYDNEPTDPYVYAHGPGFYVNEVMHHSTLIRIRSAPDTQDPWHISVADEYHALQILNVGRFERIKIDGLEGEWAFFLVPAVE